MRIIHHRDAEFTEIGVFLNQELLLCALGASAVSFILGRFSNQEFVKLRNFNA